MNKEVITLIICGAIIIVSTILGAFIYNANDRNNMAKNIETAINKGIDPISVKCAYDSSSSSTCIAYAVTAKK